MSRRESGAGSILLLRPRRRERRPVADDALAANRQHNDRPKRRVGGSFKGEVGMWWNDERASERQADARSIEDSARLTLDAHERLFARQTMMHGRRAGLESDDPNGVLGRAAARCREGREAGAVRFEYPCVGRSRRAWASRPRAR